MSSMTLHWIDRSEFNIADEDSALADWSARLNGAIAEEADPESILKQLLPELTGEYSAQCALWWERRPEWRLLIQTGRRTDESFDLALRDEVLDRESAVLFHHAGLVWVMLPISERAVIAFGGKSLDEEQAVGM